MVRACLVCLVLYGLTSTTFGEMAVTTGSKLRVQAVMPRVLERREALVAATRLFAFYSDPTFNLHDLLLAKDTPERQGERQRCFAALSAGDIDVFEAARQHYESIGNRAGGNKLLIGLRYELAGFPDVNVVADDVMAPTLERLGAVVPVYTRCWWKDHDMRNRAWIAELIPRLKAHEEAIRTRLSQLYQDDWRAVVRADIVGSAGALGANSLIDPDHVVMSSVDPSYRGSSSLEMMFHEASHAKVGPQGGAVWQALENAAVAANARPLAGQLWHPVLFYTTGKVVQRVLVEREKIAYDPYMYRGGGVFKRFHGPLEEHWQPYLDDQITLREAATRLVAALNPTPRPWHAALLAERQRTEDHLWPSTLSILRTRKRSAPKHGSR